MTFSGYRIPSNQTHLHKFVVTSYLLIPFKIFRNLNYSYLYEIKKKNIYSSVTELILTVFSNEK